MPQLPLEVIKLIKIYKEAQDNLIKIIAESGTKGSITAYKESLLRQVQAELQKLDNYSYKWVNETVGLYYQQSVDDVALTLSQQGLAVKGFEAFSLLHRGAIQVIAQNAYNDLHDAVNWVGRRMIDNIRQSGIDVTANKIATGMTVKEAKDELVNKLIDQGISAVKTKSGRNINLGAYGELVARSTTREATNRGLINQLKFNEYDLVKMSQHNSTCPVCAVLEGRIYSISGNDKRYPPLTKAHTGPYANIHPNCRHVLMVYIEALADDVEEDKRFSNRPFEIDARAKSQIEAYNKEQATKTKMRNDRYQFQRYKLSMPDDVSTFSAFRRIKNSNSPKYWELESKYRSLRAQ